MLVRVLKGVKRIIGFLLGVACTSIYVLFMFCIIFKLSYIASGSMVPVYKVGDVVLVQRMHNTDKCEKGDVVVYNSNIINALVIHRVIDVDSTSGENVLTMKGDANAKEDAEKVTSSNIYGRVVAGPNQMIQMIYKFISSMRAKVVASLSVVCLSLIYIICDMLIKDNRQGGNMKELKQEETKSVESIIKADSNEDMEFPFLGEHVEVNADDYCEENDAEDKEERPAVLRGIDSNTAAIGPSTKTVIIPLVVGAVMLLGTAIILYRCKK